MDSRLRDLLAIFDPQIIGFPANFRGHKQADLGGLLPSVLPSFDTSKLQPLTVVFALMVGGQVEGIAGNVPVIPAAASATTCSSSRS